MAPWRDVVLDVWRRGQALSAVGPGDVAEHLRHAEALVPRLETDAVCGIDLGSGAGIPGLALAGLRPDMQWTLVDAARRRTRLLEEAVRELGWTDRVSVIHERAELLPRRDGMRRTFDVVTARLFGPPAVTAECAAPLVRIGGQVLVTEPPGQDCDVEVEAGIRHVRQRERWNVAGLRVLGLSLDRTWTEPMVQELRATGDPEARFPRKLGVAAKRPLW